MPLTMVKNSTKCVIRKINGKDDVRRHLENLGFIAGETVTVVSEMAGNLIINVKGVRIAIDRSMANRIVV